MFYPKSEHFRYQKTQTAQDQRLFPCLDFYRRPAPQKDKDEDARHTSQSTPNNMRALDRPGEWAGRYAWHSVSFRILAGSFRTRPHSDKQQPAELRRPRASQIGAETRGVGDRDGLDGWAGMG